MESMKRIAYIVLAIFTLLCCANGFASSAVAVSYGQRKDRDNLKGYRASYSWLWSSRWFSEGRWYLSGYWDFTGAYYTTDGDDQGGHKDLFAVSAVPMFRLQRQPYANNLAPFLELGVGPALISETRLGNRGLGSAFQFDDRIGAGFRFGEKQRYGLTIYYNHLSNASIKHPNRGIDPSLSFSFRYYFV